ncbi:SEC10a [Scenedesmus sp. PABB004]|nr:SEC10a [Scenedesmus sp. PABB004]
MPGHASTPALINPEYFKADFSVDGFLVKLTQDVLERGGAGGGGGGAGGAATRADGAPISNEECAAATIDRVQRLIKRFIQAEYEIASLGQDVTAKLAELHGAADADEAHYKAEVRTLERLAERIKAGIRDIDGRVSAVSQTATRVGDRLQTAEGLRVRCLEAQELIAHLQAFSCHAAPDGDWGKLPPLFTNDATFAEAAAVSRRLALLAGDVAAAKQRTRMGAPPLDSPSAQTPGNLGGIGSVEHTLRVLEGYANWLENRVVGRFDAAVADDDLAGQAAAVAIMTELGKERSIAQRWVASRPMFLAFSPEVLDDWVRRASKQAPPPPRAGGGGDGGDGGDGGEDEGEQECDLVSRQARALAALFRDMHASVKDDVAAAACVFRGPSGPGLVLEMYLTRLLEQNVQAALERLLLPGGMGMAALAAAAAGAGGGGGAASGSAGGAGGGSGGGAPGLAATGGLGSFRERATSFAASFSAGGAAPGGGSGGNLAALAGSAGSGSTGGAGPPPAALQRAQLRLLAEAYGKTSRLALNLERAVRGVAAVDVLSMAESLWPALLGAYPSLELDWLAAACAEEAAQLDSPELSVPFCLALMRNSAEATARALKLSGPAHAARSARMLFHHLVAAPPAAAAAAAGGAGGAGAPGDAGAGGAGAAAGGAAPAAHPGCLLEQLARHIIGGVEHSLDLCSAGGGGGLGGLLKLGFGSATAASSRDAAAAFVGGKVRKALEAAHAAGGVMAALQAHFSDVVSPALAASPAELSAASGAALALMRAAEGSISVVLRKSVDAFMLQLERVLGGEQRKADFMPRDSAVSFDKPTSACLLGTALLAALGSSARDTLAGANRRAFLTEVSRRTHALLLAHMCRFSFSPMGALKWKEDVNEYAEVLAGFGVPAANDDMAHLQQLVNVLVVAPDSLLGLVNGSLRMAHRRGGGARAHGARRAAARGASSRRRAGVPTARCRARRDALRFIALREDFRTAKVDGKTLQELFSGEGMEGQLGAR